MAAFGDLLERVQKLNNTVSHTGAAAANIPTLDKNLRQVFEAGESLHQKVVGTSAFGQPYDSASALLATGDISLPRLGPPIGGSAGFSYEEGTGSVVSSEGGGTDLEEYLKNERETLLMSLVDNSIQKTFQDMKRRHWDAMLSDWDQQKRQFFDAIPSADLEGLGQTPAKTSFWLQEGQGSADSTMTQMEVAFAQEVVRFVEHLMEGGAVGKLIDRCVALVSQQQDSYPSLKQLWDCAACMLEVPIQAGVESVTQRLGARLRLAYVDQALAHLERQYLAHVETLVYGNLGQAQLGPRPGVGPMVQAYLNVTMPAAYTGFEDGQLEGHPIWAVLYYCLRLGDWSAAVQVASQGGPGLVDFAATLLERERSQTKRLSSDVETRLKHHYRRTVRTSNDPYKRIVYCLVAGCDVSEDHPEVCQRLEDWLWLKLTLVRHHETVALGQPANQRSAGQAHSLAAQDCLTLDQLQRIVAEDYGEVYFGKSGDPLSCFQCYWLTGQFESGLDYLYRQSSIHRCMAVHIALASYQIGTLLVAMDTRLKMCSPIPGQDNSRLKRLNLARMILTYVAKFQQTDPREAMHYYHFLKEFKTSSGDNLFMASVSDLVLQTREYELLLGKIQEDGCRRPGLIDSFHLHYNVQQLVEFVAREAETRGSRETALSLYDLAGRHKKCLELLCELLSQTITSAPMPNSTRDRLANLALRIAQRYQSHGHTAGEEIASRFYLMMDLLTFFDLFHQGRYPDALDIMRKLNLLPSMRDSVDEYLAAFHMVPEQVRRILGDILVAVLSMLNAMAKDIRSQKSVLAPRHDDQALRDVQEQAHAVVVYAGRIPYRIAGDTTARLVQLEAMIG